MRAGGFLLGGEQSIRTQRFAREADFDAFADRLQIHGLDLRHCSSVELFARFLNQTLDRLDIVIMQERICEAWSMCVPKSVARERLG